MPPHWAPVRGGSAVTGARVANDRWLLESDGDRTEVRRLTVGRTQ
jgi:hypothetical protein